MPNPLKFKSCQEFLIAEGFIINGDCWVKDEGFVAALRKQQKMKVYTIPLSKDTQECLKECMDIVRKREIS